MNIFDFLSAIEERMENATKEELEQCVIEYARMYPSEKRDEFIAFLDENLSLKQREEKDELNKIDLEQIDLIQEQLKQIEFGNLKVLAIINEEYDDWYDNMDDEYFYDDVDGVFEIMSQTITMMHDCYDQKMYEYTYQLGNSLLDASNNLQIIDDNGDYFGEKLNLFEIFDCDEIEVYESYNGFLTMLCVSAYMSVERYERTKCIYEIMEKSRSFVLSLDKMIQVANTPLPDFDQFLRYWLVFVASQEDTRLNHEIKEAIDLIDDKQYCLEIAICYISIHPGMLELVFDRYDFNDEECLQVVLKAIDLIATKYAIRSRIALIGAKSALRLERKDVAERLWFEAFKSNSSITNYLRFILNVEKLSKYTKDVQNTLKQIIATSYVSHYDYECKTNEVSNNELRMLNFFNGDLPKKYDSNVDMKAFDHDEIGIIFLCMLYAWPQDQRSGLKNALIQRVCHETNFDMKEYVRGLDCNFDESIENSEQFYDCFIKWKELMKDNISLNEKELLDFIESSISVYTNVILKANCRSKYNQCAFLIACNGLLLELHGDTDAQQKLFETYSNKYARFSRFQQELRNVGME